MSLNYIYLLFFVLSFQLCFGKENPSIKFKENKTQWPSHVKFMGEFYNGKVFLEQNSFTYEIYDANAFSLSIEKNNNKENYKAPIPGHVYKTIFVNANTKNIYGEEKQAEYYNYFLGNEKEKWSSHIQAFKKIRYENLYSGINMDVYSEGSNFKYDLIVSPQANVNQIEFKYEGVDGLSLKDKSLQIITNAGTIIEKAPLAWQIIRNKKTMVECNYELINNCISFSFPNGYNKKYSLIIDPIVVAATFSGSTSSCNGEASGYDEQGNAYLAGSCSAQGFPATLGAFQTTLNALMDVTIHKFNANGSSLLFATYLGGIDEEKSFCINALKNKITIFGYSKSNNFPVTQNSFDPTYNGNHDLFISSLDTSGSIMNASTYIGGTDDDGAPGAWNPYAMRNYEFVEDDNANIYAVSASNSLDFPVSPNAYSTSLNGIYDAVAFKIDSSLSTLVWSTYFGGIGKDCANSLRLDGQGGIYFIGTTTSMDLPITSGVAGPAFAGGSHDAYVTHLKSGGSTVAASSFAGTSGLDYGYLLTLDKNNNVLLYSLLISGSASAFTPTPNAYNVPNGRNLIHKLTPDLSQFLVKSRFGTPIFNTSQSYLAAASFEVDSCDNIYIAGDAGSNFPTTPNAIKTSTNNYDLYFCVFSKNAESLAYGSYYGGVKAEWATFGVCKVDSKGVLYYSFNGNSSTPVSTNAYAASNMPNNTIFDHGFLKVDLQTFLTATSYSSELKNGCAPYNMSFTNQTPTNNIEWVFGDGSASLFSANQVNHTYASEGIYDLLLIAQDTSTCNNVDTLITKINVFNVPTKNLEDSVKICLNGKTILNAGNVGQSYLWSTSEYTQSIEINQPGTYHVTISNPGCSVNDTSIVTISQASYLNIFPNIITPNGDNINDKLDLSNLSFTECELLIFNRWGKQIFETTSIDASWDCLINGKVIDGTYYYTLTYKTDCLKESQKSSGYITLIK
jgi:gliding motility-associated-like protein